ncbi:type I restriction enzyme HsdR N-terminal domain-containing protein [Xanthovirga aplysinae]|uniref:type I restriction enzyme HsdR N-terminal domain-containing protein n=1 Tax=Xanthovirga aplysinae TaxID=2529853 RepID=UPI0012BCE8E1|nr:type I restriction enzyme HsdR N-terminal domain-containing protein [Xanthovirga aplysinae]MTI32794.1 type I restriction enzyme HsdR N-terminal domain-containing protein [Xanthovirga aplysinae]
MIKLNLPDIAPKIKKEGLNNLIFDFIRKKYLVLTPEEWVRQHFVHYLVNQLKYPKGLIQLEGGLKYNRLSKRSDIVVFDQLGEAFLLTECKAPSVKITSKVFEQAATYNYSLKAKFVVVTNGLQHFCCQLDYDQSQTVMLDYIPPFSTGKS